MNQENNSEQRLSEIETLLREIRDLLAYDLGGKVTPDGRLAYAQSDTPPQPEPQ